MTGVMIDSAKHLPYPEIEHTARVMVGDPVALAYEWIKAYGDQLSGEYDEILYHITADELIDTAMSNINLRAGSWEDYIVKGGLLEGTTVDPVFWDKLTILKGIEIPNEKRNSFFSCSC